MSSGDSTPDWLEQGLHVRIPIVYQKPSGEKGYVSKNEALANLRRLQQYMALLMFLSAGAGVYLLATDHSLWILAVSHAIGLILVVVIDVLLGIMNLAGRRSVYVANLAAAVLAIALQLGDIATAPQYHMSMAYFASYLFKLAPFDALLLMQGMIIALGIAGRKNVQFLASRRRVGRELNYSRRSFARTLVGFGALIGFGVVLGSVKIPMPKSSPAATATTANAATPIANTNNIQAGSPVYFQYPSGYPNILFKRSDGSLAAYSLLCTHTCCEVRWEPTYSQFFCPCHGSIFGTSGNVVRGPAGYPLPTITLRVDGSGNVFPTGVRGYTPC